MPRYIPAILNGGLTLDDLAKVDRSVIPEAELKTKIMKFNYSLEAYRNKSGTNALQDYFRGLDLGNGDKIALRMNEKLAHPELPLPFGADKRAYRGPKLLDYLTDYIWLLWIKPVPQNLIKPYTLMEDPAVDGGDKGQMLSSGGKLGFKTHGICFRGDTRSYEEFEQCGFVARYSVPPGDKYHVPEAFGTVAARSMCFDTVGNDFLNQTGVCVARNLLGSMKFIGSCSTSGEEIYSTSGHLFAVQFNTGVDTERMQLDQILAQKGNKNHSILWRAGEKAAYQIPKRNFLASCKFEVDKPYHTNKNPLFKFRRLTDWSFHGASEVAQAYLKTAVANIEIGKWYDFTRRHDWAAE